MLEGEAGTGADTGQDLASAAFNSTAALYIPIHPNIKYFELAQIKYGYVDSSANVNDCNELLLLEGSSATDQLQQANYIWSSKESHTPIPETPATAAPHVVIFDSPRPVVLDDRGKLYFITTWNTAVLSAGAGEYFFIKIYGYVDSI